MVSPTGSAGPDTVSAKGWCALLKTATPTYAAQPYQQLAAVYLAEGHLGDQRTVLIAQQEDRRTRIINDEAQKWKGRARWGLRLRSAGLVINRVVIGYCAGEPCRPHPRQHRQPRSDPRTASHRPTSSPSQRGRTAGTRGCHRARQHPSLTWPPTVPARPAATHHRRCP